MHPEFVPLYIFMEKKNSKNSKKDSAVISNSEVEQPVTPIPKSQKKRSVISYANMSPELLSAFKEKYPKGYADYMGDINKIDKPNGTFFYAVSLEVIDAIYLVKIEVKIDDYDDAENGLFGDNSGDDGGEPSSLSDEDSTPASFDGDDDSDE